MSRYALMAQLINREEILQSAMRRESRMQWDGFCVWYEEGDWALTDSALTDTFARVTYKGELHSSITIDGEVIPAFNMNESLCCKGAVLDKERATRFFRIYRLLV